jgi:two-component system OmpR family response regulator
MGEAEGPVTRTILVVEDDDGLREVVVEYLREHDYLVLGAADAGEMDAILAGTTVDLVVLDVMLPGEDGHSICRRLANGRRRGIIMMSAMGGDADRIVALESGADDFLQKPFNPRELLARVRAVLRRRAATPPSTRRRRFLGVEFELGRHQLRDAEGTVVALTPGELSILSVLVQNPGRVMSRDELLEQAYGDTEVFDRAIDVHISRLRRKLAHCSAGHAIRTHRHAGYQFVAPVEWAA